MIVFGMACAKKKNGENTENVKSAGFSKKRR